MGPLILAAMISALQEQPVMERRAPQHLATQSKTWSLSVVLEPCGDVVIDRIDEYRVDAPELGIVSSPNQRKVLQWTVYGIVDRRLTLGQVLVEMTQARYVFRVFYRAAGVGGVKFLYISPYGASDDRIPPLPPEAAHDLEVIYRWRSLHEWSPRSPFNPDRSAFDHAFPTLLNRVDARMEMAVVFSGPGCRVPMETKIP